jgi:hypothetical protein
MRAEQQHASVLLRDEEPRSQAMFSIGSIGSAKKEVRGQGAGDRQSVS